MRSPSASPELLDSIREIHASSLAAHKAGRQAFAAELHRKVSAAIVRYHTTPLAFDEALSSVVVDVVLWCQQEETRP